MPEMVLLVQLGLGLCSLFSHRGCKPRNPDTKLKTPKSQHKKHEIAKNIYMHILLRLNRSQHKAPLDLPFFLTNFKAAEAWFL